MIKEKIVSWIQKRQQEMQKGLEVTQQRKLERRQKQLEKLRPGDIRYGLIYQQDPLTFMKDAYEERKSRREAKKK